MTEMRRELRAEIVDDNVFKVFAGEEDEFYLVYVDKYESYPWVENRCDECERIARGIGFKLSIFISSITDAKSNQIKVDMLQFTQILAEIMVCCSELHHGFICDTCMDKEKQKLLDARVS